MEVGAPPCLEVSGESLEPFGDYAKALGLEESKLFQGVEHLQPRPKRVHWSDYRRLHQNLGRYAGSNKDLVELGGLSVQNASISRVVRACSLFFEPSTFFMNAPPFVYARYLPFLKVRAERRGEAVYLEIAVPEGVPSCPEWLYLTQGALQNALLFMGLGPARVELELFGQGGRYLIYPPPSKTLYTRLKLAFRIFKNSGETVERMHIQQQELEQQNQELRRALEARNKALQARDRFLQTVGHELRTPLNGLRVAIDTEGAPTPQVWEILKISAHRLSTTLEAILAYAKYSSDDIRAQPRVEHLPRFVRSALEAVGPHEQVTCTLQDAWFSFDLEHTRCALSELVRNAMQADPDGAAVSVVGHFSEGVLRIEVTDQGAGIPEERVEELFEAFFQLEEAEARKRAGLGLGLTVARAAVQGIGGRIGLQPRLGGGTCAWVEVPAQPASPPSRPEKRSTRKILVVDDDAINRKVAKRLLERAGCVVDTADDGTVCLERLEGEEYDLILMDCEMPGLDGWATTRQLRALGRRMPVVAATAYTSEADRQRCADAGMDDFLSKPLKPQTVAEVLNRWLGAP